MPRVQVPSSALAYTGLKETFIGRLLFAFFGITQLKQSLRRFNLLNLLIWDAFEIQEFFNHNFESYHFSDNEDGFIFFAQSDGVKAEIIILPVSCVICITLRDNQSNILIDLSILVRSNVDRREIDGVDTLYVHECTVLPGIHSYTENVWDQFFRYSGEPFKYVSMQFKLFPEIGVRVFDTNFLSVF